MCRALGVNRTSFHDWQRRAPSDRELTDAWLTEKIKQIHADSDGTYGARRIHAELRLEHGIRVGRKRVERLMKAAGISGLLPRKRRRTTVRLPGVRVAPDLVERDFRPDGPNQTWSADITYISTWEGFLYLAHVQDLFSRLIVGWSMADHLRSELVVDALEMALARRRPDRGLIHHSDQGCQFTAVLFTKRCAKAGIEVSMGSVGDCYDNAVCETFHASLKKEKIYRQSWPTRAAARTAIFEYIEGWYNPRRRHSTLAYLSPIEFERHHTELAQLALERLDFGQRIGRVDLAEGLRRAYNALASRRSASISLPTRSDLSRERPRPSNRSRSGRDGRWSRDERQRVASPTGSQGTSSLIQTSTTTAKTCRPNRGRSTRSGPSRLPLPDIRAPPIVRGDDWSPAQRELFRALAQRLLHKHAAGAGAIEARERFRVEAHAQPHPPAPRSPPRVAQSLAHERFLAKRASGSRPRRVVRRSCLRPRGIVMSPATGRALGHELEHVRVPRSDC